MEGSSVETGKIMVPMGFYEEELVFDDVEKKYQFLPIVGHSINEFNGRDDIMIHSNVTWRNTKFSSIENYESGIICPLKFGGLHSDLIFESYVYLSGIFSIFNNDSFWVNIDLLKKTMESTAWIAFLEELKESSDWKKNFKEMSIVFDDSNPRTFFSVDFKNYCSKSKILFLSFLYHCGYFNGKSVATMIKQFKSSCKSRFNKSVDSFVEGYENLSAFGKSCLAYFLPSEVDDNDKAKGKEDEEINLTYFGLFKIFLFHVFAWTFDSIYSRCRKVYVTIKCWSLQKKIIVILSTLGFWISAYIVFRITFKWWYKKFVRVRKETKVPFDFKNIVMVMFVPFVEFCKNKATKTKYRALFSNLLMTLGVVASATASIYSTFNFEKCEELFNRFKSILVVEKKCKTCHSKNNFFVLNLFYKCSHCMNPVKVSDVSVATHLYSLSFGDMKKAFFDILSFFWENKLDLFLTTSLTIGLLICVMLFIAVPLAYIYAMKFCDEHPNPVFNYKGHFKEGKKRRGKGRIYRRKKNRNIEDEYIYDEETGKMVLICGYCRAKGHSMNNCSQYDFSDDDYDDDFLDDMGNRYSRRLPYYDDIYDKYDDYPEELDYDPDDPYGDADDFYVGYKEPGSGMDRKNKASRDFDKMIVFTWECDGDEAFFMLYDKKVYRFVSDPRKNPKYHGFFAKELPKPNVVEVVDKISEVVLKEEIPKKKGKEKIDNVGMVREGNSSSIIELNKKLNDINVAINKPLINKSKNFIDPNMICRFANCDGWKNNNSSCKKNHSSKTLCVLKTCKGCWRNHFKDAKESKGLNPTFNESFKSKMVYLRSSLPSYGSGFLVKSNGKTLLFTAAHNVTKEIHKSNASNIEYLTNSVYNYDNCEIISDLGKPIVCDVEKDYAVFDVSKQLNHCKGFNIAYVSTSTVYVCLGYNRTDSDLKIVDFATCTGVAIVKGGYLNYASITTEKGASGTPVIDSKGNVVGIHINGPQVGGQALKLDAGWLLPKLSSLN